MSKEEVSTFGSISSTVCEHVESAVQVSRVLRPNADEEAFYRELTLGIEESLQAHPMIKDIKMVMRPPAPLSAITAWERKNMIKLPSDLKDYYSSTNGFKLTWNLDYAGDLLKIGEMCVNSLHQLNPLETELDSNKSASNTADSTAPAYAKQWGVPSLAQTDPSKKIGDAYLRISFEELQQTVENAKKSSRRSKVAGLTLGAKGKAFQLDSSRPELGLACLVYPATKTTGPGVSDRRSEHSEAKAEPDVQIWFLDPSYQWHFLAPTFSHYYRMLLYHQGMPQWQYRFTSFGISAWAEQMFWLVTPHLLQPEKISAPKTDSTIWSLDVPPEAACPNPTKNVLNMSIFRKKKKDKKRDDTT